MLPIDLRHQIIIFCFFRKSSYFIIFCSLNNADEANVSVIIFVIPAVLAVRRDFYESMAFLQLQIQQVV